MNLLKGRNDYVYDSELNFYRNTGKKLIPISKKMYQKKTGESDYLIAKLRNSAWSIQGRDYFFMKIKSKKYDYAPIDWALYNLVVYFNKNNFFTSNTFLTGLVTKRSKDVSRIFFSESRIEYAKLLQFLKEKINSIEIVEFKRSHDFRTDGLNMIEKWWCKEKHSNKLVVSQEDITKRNGLKTVYILISFENRLLYKIYDCLNLKMPERKNAYRGGRYISKSRMEKIKNEKRK